MLDTIRAAVCAVLAVLLAVTPLGSLAHVASAGSDFRPDLCTAAGKASEPSATPEEQVRLAGAVLAVPVVNVEVRP